ncbi:hypothetical protein FQN54_002468 [Arachnomyces sp. PD_36]|nr:hypothetical protein FQN54_002468 [Arachnomyces sp. PD_36]
MANKYEHRSNSELIEILELRSLPQTGKKADYIARLLEHDRFIQELESTRPSDMPDVQPTSGDYLLYIGDTPRMSATVMRIRNAIASYNVSFRLLDMKSSAFWLLYWRKESKGRSLPALVKSGRIIGGLGEIRWWLDSDDPFKRIMQACESEGLECIQDPSGLICKEEPVIWNAESVNTTSE